MKRCLAFSNTGRVIQLDLILCAKRSKYGWSEMIASLKSCAMLFATSDMMVVRALCRGCGKGQLLIDVSRPEPTVIPPTLAAPHA